MASPTLHLSPQFDDEAYMEESEVFAVNAARHLQELQRLSAFQQVTTKVPPAYDGRSSWFAYEDAIDDWVDITELEPEKQGPALRNRLEGEAAIHKRLLDRGRLKDKVNGSILVLHFIVICSRDDRPLKGEALPFFSASSPTPITGVCRVR